MKVLDVLIYSNKWSIRILRHVLFWTIDCISVLVVISADNNELNSRIIYSRFLVVPLTAAVAYFIIYYLIPSYSKDRDRLKFILGILFSFLFVAYGIRFYRLNLIYPIVDPTFIFPEDIWSFSRVIRDTFRWMPGITLAIAIKMIKNRAELLQKNQQLMEEKKKAELAFLKAQMHPHFLFNTLNTLYSYSIKNGNGTPNDKSEEIVLRLSNLMRFILEECDKRLIPIESEIKVIEDYFHLKKLRHGDRLRLDYSLTKNGTAYISPLLLLPIVENSVKHTLSSNDGKVDIKLVIKSESGYISLYIENDLIKNETSAVSHGTGLRSVRRQLELLYGDDFLLEVNKSKEKFVVNLKVPTEKKDE